MTLAEQLAAFEPPAYVPPMQLCRLELIKDTCSRLAKLAQPLIVGGFRDVTNRGIYEAPILRLHAWLLLDNQGLVDLFVLMTDKYNPDTVLDSTPLLNYLRMGRFYRNAVSSYQCLQPFRNSSQIRISSQKHNLKRFVGYLHVPEGA